jgi:hypothetical protein
MAVTKEQVFAAADQISVAGQRPTLEAVRKITGGSYTTISPALNEWKARQATTAAPLREPAPPGGGRPAGRGWRRVVGHRPRAG